MQKAESKTVDTASFVAARRKVLGSDRARSGIGTLSEKTLHAILKNYYEPDEAKQEIPIEGYVADICTGQEIIEIQTGQFNRMREKLKAFLPEHKVTIVYPIPCQKWILWIDEETGEISERRKSPKRGSAYDIFPELYRIKFLLKEPNLHIRAALIDMEEYKLLNGWGKHRKNNASRYDRIPLELVEEVELGDREDYRRFLPEELPDSFTSKDLAKSAHIPAKRASLVLNLLLYMDVVERVGRQGRSYLYEKKK